MTGLGEDDHPAPNHFPDAGKMVDAMVAAAIRAAWKVPGKCHFSTDHVRAALESLRVPLSDIEGLRSGRLHAVSDADLEKAFQAAIRIGHRLAESGVPISAAPKTPEE